MFIGNFLSTTIYILRDLKLENIMVTEDSDGDVQTKIIDFGLAKKL